MARTYNRQQVVDFINTQTRTFGDSRNLSVATACLVAGIIIAYNCNLTLDKTFNVNYYYKGTKSVTSVIKKCILSDTYKCYGYLFNNDEDGFGIFTLDRSKKKDGEYGADNSLNSCFIDKPYRTLRNDEFNVNNLKVILKEVFRFKDTDDMVGCSTIGTIFKTCQNIWNSYGKHLEENVKKQNQESQPESSATENETTTDETATETTTLTPDPCTETLSYGDGYVYKCGAYGQVNFDKNSGNAAEWDTAQDGARKLTPKQIEWMKLKIMNFYLGKNMTVMQTCAIIGNIEAESAYKNAQSWNQDYDSTGKPAGKAFGLFSMNNPGGIYPAYKSWCATNNRSEVSLDSQMEFVYYVCQTGKGLKKEDIPLLTGSFGKGSDKKPQNLDALTVAFQDGFENCGTCHTEDRKKYAENAMKFFAAHGHETSTTDCKEDAIPTTSNATINTSDYNCGISGSNKPLVVGDSWMVGMSPTFIKNGYNSTAIIGAWIGGEKVRYDTVGYISNKQTHLKYHYPASIQIADYLKRNNPPHIVVVCGINGACTGESAIKKMLKDLSQACGSTRIYMLRCMYIASTKTAHKCVDTVNKCIDSHEFGDKLNLRIIDFAKKYGGRGGLIKATEGDGIHPTGEYVNMANFILEQIKVLQ